MLDALLKSYAYTTRWVIDGVADVREPDRARSFPGIPNHPAWTVGHLVFSAQAIGGELDLPEWLDATWRTRFGPGSSPTAEAAAYPPLAELAAELSAAARRVHDHLASRSTVFFNEPLPDARFRSLLPTRGHAALQVLVGHSAFHAGQLAVWRRAAGLPGRPFV